MGCSLGLSLKKYISKIKIYGDDLKQKNLKYSLENQAIDYKLTETKIKNMDIIFIAVPVKNTLQVIKKIYKYLDINTIITDLGSTKEQLITEVNKSFPDLKFIGGHPMAGKETSGPQTAEADLFYDKSYIIINEKNNFSAEKNILKNLLEKIGANIVFLSAATHDKLVAKTSHLPQIMASALISEFIKSEDNQSQVAKLVGTGFLDTTRIAASNPEIWIDIFMTNKDNIVQEIDSIINSLEEFRDNLVSENDDLIFDFLEKTKNKRVAIAKELENRDENTKEK